MTASEPRSAAPPVRILIVDDHPLVRLGFAQLLSQERDLEVCGEAESAAAALALLDELEPELLVVDISLKGTNGLELVKQVRGRRPAATVLVCSMHDEALFAERALRAGARGYIGKNEAAEELVTAVRAVLAGRRYLPPRLAARIEAAGLGAGDELPEPIAVLSDRELEVFELIGRGVGTREIAERLGLAIKTVESYRENIKQKLLIESGPELARRAVAWVLGE